MVWIRTIDPNEAEGRLADAYAWQSRKLGRPTEFTQLGSLDAEIVHARLVLYRASENVLSRLTHRQRQLISYLTSILNATPHCASLARPQLSEAPDLLSALDSRDYDTLPAAEAALARYVAKLTLEPGAMCLEDVQALREVGFDDLDILDANNQCAHLNYTNRVANGLGLLSEAVLEERTLDRIPT
ncbi:MAG TPA: hypothetical protein VFG86_18995 [Chloroflexota bacterium]|nr:hypothetical protein [Chloroflexota bacterium]